MPQDSITRSIISYQKNAYQLYKSQRDIDSVTELEKALRIACRFNAKLSQIQILNQIGDVYIGSIYFEQAQKVYKEAYQVSSSGDFFGSTLHALCFNNLARVMWKKGNYSKSLTFSHECLNIIEHKVPGSLHHGNALANIGLVYFRLGLLDKALRYSNQALTIIGKKAQNSYFLANILNNIAEIYAKKKDFGNAVDFCQQSLEIVGSICPNSLEEFRLLNKIGNFCKKKGSMEDAISYFKVAWMNRFNFPLEDLPDNYPDFVKNNYDLFNSYCLVGKYEHALSSKFNFIAANAGYKYNCSALSKVILSKSYQVKNGLDLLLKECNSALKIDPNYLDAAIIKFEVLYIMQNSIKVEVVDQESISRKIILMSDLLESYDEIVSIAENWKTSKSKSDGQFIGRERIRAYRAADLISQESDHQDLRKLKSLVRGVVISLPKRKFDSKEKIAVKVDEIKESLMLVTGLNQNILSLILPAASPQKSSSTALNQAFGEEFLIPLS